MKIPRIGRPSEQAFSRTDMILATSAFAVLCFLAVMFSLMLGPAKHNARKINCSSNLRHIGLAFATWKNDNFDIMPMQTYTNSLGDPLYASASKSHIYFQMMSNELENPQSLLCPEDSSKFPAENFGSNFGCRNISYFIGLEARDSFPNSLLAGDNHLGNGHELIDGKLILKTNQEVSWGKRHRSEGELLLTCGSVEDSFANTLPETITKTGLATNILLMNR